MDVLSLLHEEGVGGGISVNRFDDDDDDDNKHQGSDSDEKSESDKMQQKNQECVIREPKLRERGNTGVKGVINDYKEAQEKMIKRLERERIEKLKYIIAHTPMVKSYREEEAENNKANKMNIMNNDNNVDNDDDDDDDDEFFRKYKEYRMAELRRTLNSNVDNKSQQKILFGKIFDVTADNFVDFIDKENPTTTIIIHLYQPHLKPCIRLNEALEELASNYPTVKFGRMLSTDAKQSFDEVALPALLIYRNQVLEGAYLRLIDDLGYNFDVDDVEEFLTTTTKVLDPKTRVNNE